MMTAPNSQLQIPGLILCNARRVRHSNKLTLMPTPGISFGKPLPDRGDPAVPGSCFGPALQICFVLASQMHVRDIWPSWLYGTCMNAVGAYTVWRPRAEKHQRTDAELIAQV